MRAKRRTLISRKGRPEPRVAAERPARPTAAHTCPSLPAVRGPGSAAKGTAQSRGPEAASRTQPCSQPGARRGGHRVPRAAATQEALGGACPACRVYLGGEGGRRGRAHRLTHGRRCPRSQGSRGPDLASLSSLCPGPPGGMKRGTRVPAHAAPHPPRAGRAGPRLSPQLGPRTLPSQDLPC